MPLQKTRLNVISVILVSTLGAAPAAFADHASPWGEGWANMPNDIHNTRRDTLDGDNSTFTGFVRYGDGADSVNRFLDDDLTTRAGGTGGSGIGAGIGTSATRGTGRR